MPSFQLANLSGIGLTVGFLVVGVLAGLWLALLAWRFRDSDYVRYVFGSAVFVVLALLAHRYELLDASFQGSVVAYYGIHMAFPYIAAFLALFTLSYIGARWWENPWVLVAIFAVPVALTLLLPFDASLHFFDLRHTLDRSLLYWPVQHEHGIGVVILVIYDISMVGIALVSVLGFAIRVSRRYLPQIVVLSVSITAPYITSVLNMYHLVFMGEYLVTPAFGLIFSVLGLLWAALRWGLFEASPTVWGQGSTARDDAVLAVSKDLRVVDANPTAKHLFEGDILGRSYQQILVGIPFGQMGVYRLGNLEYDVKFRAIHGSSAQIGHQIVPHDVIDLKATELELRRVNSELEILRDELREQSIRDKLTTLFNRRHLDSELPRRIALAQTRQEDLSIMLLDIDHFRQFNARWGYASGDDVLRALGSLLTNCAGPAFIPCRYGGEEFAVILPGLTLEQARQSADRLRQTAADLEIPFQERRLQVTISVAVASLHQQGAQHLQSAADEALRRAKVRGRNRVELPSSPKRTWGTGWG